MLFRSDSDVLEEMQKAVKAIAGKMDAKFYSLPSDYLSSPVTAEKAGKQAQMSV